MRTRVGLLAALLATLSTALPAAAQTPAAEPTPVAEPAAATGPTPATEPAAATKPTPASEPTPASGPATPEGSADDSFALESSGSELVTEDAPKLDLYGFADFAYFQALGKKSNVVRQYVAPYPTFYVGHLNLYLSSTLGENWRSLAEVRFTYSPTGDDDRQAADGTFPVPDTTVQDYAELQRTLSWGGIEMQRAWIEYQPLDFLTVRGGQWFTPYGYWNMDHGSPTIIAVHKPFPISDYLFPEKQTGLEAYGKVFIDSTAIGYFLTLSNGRGPYDAFRDLDNNKAVGGRLYLETTALGNLTIGVDAYRGRYTASTKRYRVDTSGSAPIAVIYRSIDVAYDELSLGADVRWMWKGLHLQAEVMMNEAAYNDAHRPPAQGFDPRPTFASDYRRVGGYVLLAYRTPFFNLMPYVMGEYSSYANTDLAPPTYAWTAGLNLRATPNVVLKAEAAIATFDGTGSTGLGADDLPYFGAQAAWAF